MDPDALLNNAEIIFYLCCLNYPQERWVHLHLGFKLILALFAGIQFGIQVLQRLCLVLKQILLDGLIAILQLVAEIVHVPQLVFTLKLMPSSISPVSFSLTARHVEYLVIPAVIPYCSYSSARMQRKGALPE